MMKDLTKNETEKLRLLHWELLEAQERLKKALNDIALAHGCDLEKERWNVTPDFRRLEKVK